MEGSTNTYGFLPGTLTEQEYRNRKLKSTRIKKLRRDISNKISELENRGTNNKPVLGIYCRITKYLKI